MNGFINVEDRPQTRPGKALAFAWMVEILAALQEEVAGVRQQAQRDIEDVRTSNTAGGFVTERARVEQEMASLDQRREAALNSERARCRANPNTRCNISTMAGSFGRQRDELSRRISGWLARRRRSNLPVQVKEITKEVPIDRIKIIFLPLDATEEQIAQARRDARQEAA